MPTSLPTTLHTATAAGDVPTLPVSAFVHRLVAGTGHVRLASSGSGATLTVPTTVWLDSDLLDRLETVSGGIGAALCVLADFGLEQWAANPLHKTMPIPERGSHGVARRRRRICVPKALHARLQDSGDTPATALCNVATWALRWLGEHGHDLESRLRRETREYTLASGEFALRVAVVDDGSDDECHRVMGCTCRDACDVLFYDPGNGEPKQFTQAYYRLWAEAMAMDLERALPTAPAARRHRL